MLLQIAIAATGNYAFFNLLTIALAVLLVDDASFPRRWSEAAREPTPAPALGSLAPVDPDSARR